MSVRDKALRATSLSELMEVREKGDMSELCAKGEVTLRDYDVVSLTSKKTGEMQDTAVMIFDEFPNLFFFGGLVASQMCKQFDADDKAEIKASGLKMRFYRAKAKTSGNELTRIEII